MNQDSETEQAYAMENELDLLEWKDSFLFSRTSISPGSLSQSFSFSLPALECGFVLSLEPKYGRG
jgi:hypothetical protein